MTIPTLDEVKAEIEALPPGEGYDGNGDPRIVDLIVELIRQDWAEAFRTSPSGMTMVRKRDPRDRDHDLAMIDLLMQKHRWAKVERTIGKTTATRVDE